MLNAFAILIFEQARSLSTVSTADFVHRLDATPTITTVSKKRGSTAGGTTIRIATALKTTEIPHVEVYISGVPCVVSSVTLTYVDCVTGYHGDTNITHQGTYNIDLRVRGLGRAVPITRGVSRYRYADFWSSPTTWGGKQPPIAGDLVHIPIGKTVILDVSTPILSVMIVEGKLEFDDSDATGQSYLELRAHYITVVGGTLQIGTEDEPYQNKATITLFGSPSDTELPMYGSKVLACRRCTLDLHGKPTKQTWTRLSSTAYSNTTQIVLQQEVDWAIGSTIVIASTDHNKEHAEEVVITQLLNDGK